MSSVLLLLLSLSHAQEGPPPSCRLQSFVARNKDSAEIGEELRPAVFAIKAGGEHRGTGFLIDSTGYALTARHVVFDEEDKPIASLTAVLRSRRESDLTVFPELLSPGVDAALVKLDPDVIQGIRPLDVGLSAPPLNSTVYSVGYGRPGDSRVQKGTFEQILDEKFQARLEAIGGDSGSPLLNQNGAAIGITIQGDGVAAVSTAIPLSFLGTLLRKVPASARINRLDDLLRARKLKYEELAGQLLPTYAGCTSMELYAWASRMIQQKQAYRDSAAMIRCPFYRALAHRGLEDLAAEFGDFLSTLEERKEHASLLLRVYRNGTRTGNQQVREKAAVAIFSVADQGADGIWVGQPEQRQFLAFATGNAARMAYQLPTSASANFDYKLQSRYLLNGLRDPDPWVRQESAFALGAVTVASAQNGKFDAAMLKSFRGSLEIAQLQPNVREQVLAQMQAAEPAVAAEPLLAPFSVLGTVLGLTAAAVAVQLYAPNILNSLRSLRNLKWWR